MQKLIAYQGNRSFAARNAAFSDEAGMQRFFVRENGWADIRIGSISGFEKLGLKADTEFRPGGTASSGLQVRWAPEVVAKLGYEFVPVLSASRKGAFDPTEFLLAAASK